MKRELRRAAEQPCTKVGRMDSEDSRFARFGISMKVTDRGH